MVGFERFGREKLTQDVWTGGILNEENVAREKQSAIQKEKEVLKQRMESEITRHKENARIIKEKQEKLATRIAEVRAEVASDDGTDPNVTGARTAILKKYEKYKDSGDVLLTKEMTELEEWEARYQTISESLFPKE